jgi:5-methylcytosine-specific restriction protein A
MAFPSYKEIEIPLLIYIYKNGGKISSASSYEPLAKIFSLTDNEMVQLLDDGTNRPQWKNMVQWARKSLVDYGYLHNAKISGTGVWELTEAGFQKAILLSNKIEVNYPDDVSESFFEGAVKEVKVNRYERSKTARDKCVDHYGYKCAVCSMNFEEKYGELGRDFIHVHHIIPISEIGKLYELDPIRDLRPVCPNCHSMIHRRVPPLSVEELKKLVKSA